MVAQGSDDTNHAHGYAILDDRLDIDAAPDEFRIAGLHACLIGGKMAVEYLAESLRDDRRILRMGEIGRKVNSSAPSAE